MKTYKLIMKVYKTL